MAFPSAVWDAEFTMQSRLRIYCNLTFTLLNTTLARQLGFFVESASADAERHAEANDGAGAVSTADGFNFMMEVQRFTNLMPRSYVDIVVPELPPIGTKTTNSAATSRVVARIPLGGTPGGSQYYQPQPHQLLRTQFHPITLPFFTVQLVGSDGEPYDSRDTPHTLSFELVQLSDPEPPPPEPPDPNPVSEDKLVILF